MSVKYVEREKYKSKFSYNKIYFFNFKDLFMGPIEKYDQTKGRPEPRIILIETINQWNQRRR